MADYRIFPSIIPESDSVSAIALSNDTDAWVLQGIAAAHPTEDVNGQSAGMEIAFWLSGNHTSDEIQRMVAIITDSEPPRSDIDLSAAFDNTAETT
jgi:hypothetical protein